MSNRKLPTHFHIGTQKAGSTYLYNLLASHPEVSLSSQTEIHYYSKHFAKGDDWYLSLFKKPGTKIDTSPKYFMNGDIVAPRIKAVSGEEAKFLLVLRNPIDLLNSHYQMHAVSGNFYRRPHIYPTVPKNVIECVTLYPNYLKQASYYSELTSHWFKHFSRAQFKIVFFERFIKNVDSEMASILDFFTLTPAQLSAGKTSKNKMLRSRFLFNLRSKVINIPVLKDILKSSSFFGHVYDNYLTAPSGEMITSAEREELAQLLSPEVKQLQELLGDTIVEWRDFN